jgi:hypothetical protein
VRQLVLFRFALIAAKWIINSLLHCRHCLMERHAINIIGFIAEPTDLVGPSMKSGCSSGSNVDLNLGMFAPPQTIRFPEFLERDDFS